MPWTLVNALQNEREPFRKGVLSVFYFESNLMAALPWESVDVLVVEMTRINRLALTQSAWVRLGAALGTATIDLERLQEEVFKLGVDVDIPRDLVGLKGQFEDPRVVNVEANVKAMAYMLNAALVNGPNVVGSSGAASDNSITGIRTRITQKDALTGLGNALVETAANGTAFGPTASSANRHTVLDTIDTVFYFIDGHRPDFGICNDTLLLALNSALRREGTLFEQSRDQYQRWVSSYRGAPLYDAGLIEDQATRIISNGESVGTSGDATSLFWLKTGVGTHFHGIEKDGLSTRDIGELETAPTLRTRIEWLLGVADWHPRSLGRVAGIRAQA